MKDNDSTFIGHEPCPSCGSKDNLARYTDGHGFCFGCSHYEHGDGEPGEPKQRRRMAEGLITGEVKPLQKRGITEETCRKFQYQVGKYKDAAVQIAPYFDADGRMVAQKIRTAGKDFKVLGDISEAQLFGAQLWSTGKKVVVTEGEIDCLTVSQVQGNKWPVVSVPNGAQGARKALAKNLSYFDKFEEVILMFDMDEPGRKAAAECAELFPAGKARIASLSMKDPNELLMAGKEQDIIQAIWNAKEHRPDGIIEASDLLDLVIKEDVVQSVPYPWAHLNNITRGARRGELVTLTAGSGIGKSAVVREIASHLIHQGETVGMMMLEENPKRTLLGLLGIEMNKPLHITREGVTQQEMQTAFNKLFGTKRVFLYDHFGSSEIDNLMNRIRYLIKACGCNWIILDHLSIVVSGLGDGDERRLIDNAMTSLRTLVEETGVGMFLVSHLRRPEGDRGHEQGARTSLSQLRGSHAIAQLSDIVVGLERDQQGKSPNITTLRVLKNRFTGETGEAGYLHYERQTGRLSEVEEPVFENSSQPDIDGEF